MRVFQWLAMLLAALVLVGCTTEDSFRYKMTVEVETPDGILSSSAVREVTRTEPWVYGPFSSRVPRWEVEGEAVAIDLPNGRPLCALLTGVGLYGSQAHRSMAGIFESSGAVIDQEIDIWTASSGDAPLGRDIYRPMIVVLIDPSDPASVVEVSPPGETDPLGDGVTLRRITVALTTEEPSFGVIERYPWILEYKDKYLNGSEKGFVDMRLERSAQLTGAYFSTGVLK